MIYNVLDYGAVPDHKTVCTEAIQAAIDACAAAGGGTVLIPAGDYLTGGLILKSNVHVHFEMGATLFVSPDKEHYTYNAGNPKRPSGHSFLFYACEEKNITIDGYGTVHGTGEDDYGVWWGLERPMNFRVGLLLLEKCEHVHIEEVTFKYSDNWTLHFLQCENVWIHKARIMNNTRHLHSDGIDPDSCKNFFISDCYIQTGDDCICPKASVAGVPMENLVVTNCVLETPTTAIKIGTASYGNFTDMHFSDITIRNSSIGIGFFVKDGALVERATFNNISIQNADWEDIKPIIPIFMDIEKRRENSIIGKIRDVSFSNIMINSASGALIQGMPESQIENVSLSNIVFRAPKACDLSIRKKQIGGGRSTPDDGRDTTFIRKNAYFAFAHTVGLSLDNITVVQEEAAQSLDMNPIYLYDSDDAQVTRIKMRR